MGRDHDPDDCRKREPRSCTERGRRRCKDCKVRNSQAKGLRLDGPLDPMDKLTSLHKHTGLYIEHRARFLQGEGNPSVGLQVLCLSNNPLIRDCVSRLEFIDGSSCDVILRARDLIHRGWRLLGHPLYGNFHVKKHPYRTLALQKQQGEGGDMDSLVLIESALSACAQDARKGVLPEDLPDSIAHDYSFLDRALMAETLKTYKLWTGEPQSCFVCSE